MKSLSTPEVVSPATSVIASDCHVPGTNASGTFPMIVVNDVRNIGSNRERPASRMASSIESHDLRLRLILSMSTIELLTTMPKSATKPINDGNERVEPESVRPKNTPMSESGIGASMRRACL